MNKKYYVAMCFIVLAMLTVETVGTIPVLCFVSLAIAGAFTLSANLDEERKRRKARRRAEVLKMRRDNAA